MTVEYAYGKPVRVDTVVISTQHEPNVTHDEIDRIIKSDVIEPVIPADLLDEKTHYYINPTGRFVTGGPMGDAGLTGRKIIVDTYGGIARHGGGAFSGKDPTKVDRSAAYAARYVAKNVVAAGLADRCEIQLSYAIGVAQPHLDHGRDLRHRAHIRRRRSRSSSTSTSICGPARSSATSICAVPSTRPRQPTATSGATISMLPWEKTDKADLLRREAGLSSDEKLEVLVPSTTGDGNGRQAKAAAVAAKN